MSAKTWINNYFTFQGRIGRASCWLYIAIATPLSVVLVLAVWAYAWSVPGAYENGGPTPFPTSLLGVSGAILFFLALAAVTFSGIAVTVKRLHDRNKASWWIAVFLLLPDCLFGLAQYLEENGFATNGGAVFLLQVAALAFSVWGVIELGFSRGTIGANRFGPDPLAANDSHQSGVNPAANT